MEPARTRIRTVQFAVSGSWALAADSLQWMLQRRYGHGTQVGWKSISFVSSTKTILARCMREKDCPPEDAERLLAGLPDTFDEWMQASGRQLFGRSEAAEEADPA
jgi:hypothetical protein